jgi:hypothetical protein
MWIFQGAAKTHKRGKILFTRRPLERFKGSHIWPQFAHKPLKRIRNMQLGPQAWGRRRRRNSGEVLAGEGWERGGASPRSRIRPTCGPSWVGAPPARGHRGAAVPWLSRIGAPAGWRPGRPMHSSGGLQGVLEEGLGGWDVAGSGGRRSRRDG